VSKKEHVPLRTCIGCRKKRKKEDMVWFTQGLDGTVRVNGKGPHHGRGFYLCPDLGCFNMAKKKKRGVGFQKTIDFHDPSIKRFLKSEKNGDRGGRE